MTYQVRRYVTLYVTFLRVSLIRELMFRTNFAVRLAAHVVWFAAMIGFFETIFLHTERVGDWDRYRYLVFLGTFLAINGTVNALFIGNCVELGELIRTGNLDFALLKPIDEQFLITCRRIDWALMPQILFGFGVAGYGAKSLGVPIDASRILIYVVLVMLGVAILYSVLLIMTSLSFWTVQHRELFELWFLLLQFANYPDEIYRRQGSSYSLGTVFSYIVPMVLAINVPAKYGAMLLSGWTPVAVILIVSSVMLLVCRVFFRLAIKQYRSSGS